MNRILRTAAALAASLAAVGLAILPASAAPQSPQPAGQIYNEIPYFCIALASHGAGHRAAGAMCSGSRSQLWAVRGSRIVTASGLCLTATADGQVITARCGWPHGQRWTLLRGATRPMGSHRIESRRFGGSCLALPPSYTGPVQLNPCDGPPVNQGGTGYWVTGQ